MENCPSCSMARENPDSGMYHSGCIGCTARAIASSPAHFESAKAKKMTLEYQAGLKATGLDRDVIHAMVKAWKPLP